MSHWAEIDNESYVIRTMVGENDSPDEGESFFKNLIGGTWIKTSINTIGGIHYSQELDSEGNRVPSADQSKSLRKNYAGPGYFYDKELDAFIPPKPFASWILNAETCLWEAPQQKPDGEDYIWSEEEQSWILVSWDDLD